MNTSGITRFQDKEKNTLSQIQVNGSHIWVMVDTGAAANVVDEVAFNLWTTKPELVQNKPYFGFGNPKTPRLFQMGKCDKTAE